MTSEQFVNWLQGFMEISSPDKLDGNQLQIIKDHLDLVFDKKTPERREYKPHDKEQLEGRSTRIPKSRLRDKGQGQIKC